MQVAIIANCSVAYLIKVRHQIGRNRGVVQVANDRKVSNNKVAHSNILNT